MIWRQANIFDVSNFMFFGLKKVLRDSIHVVEYVMLEYKKYTLKFKLSTTANR